jgi:predicted transcriptional regulator
MKKLFLKTKPSAILILLKDSQQSWYPSKLARAASMSYVHTVNLLAELSALGIVTHEKKGKQNFYKLTEKGAYLALSLEDFSKKCDTAEQEAKQQAKAEEKPPQEPPAQKP